MRFSRMKCSFSSSGISNSPNLPHDDDGNKEERTDDEDADDPGNDRRGSWHIKDGSQGGKEDPDHADEPEYHLEDEDRRIEDPDESLGDRVDEPRELTTHVGEEGSRTG